MDLASALSSAWNFTLGEREGARVDGVRQIKPL